MGSVHVPHVRWCGVFVHLCVRVRARFVHAWTAYVNVCVAMAVRVITITIMVPQVRASSKLC